MAAISIAKETPISIEQEARYGLSAEEKKLLSLLGVKPLTVKSVA